MKISYTPKFLREYKKLPLEIKVIAEKKEKIFRRDPYDVSLKTHKLSGGFKDFSAFSINFTYRIIFECSDDDQVYFHSVGDHSIYD